MTVEQNHPAKTMGMHAGTNIPQQIDEHPRPQRNRAGEIHVMPRRPRPHRRQGKNFRHALFQILGNAIGDKMIDLQRQVRSMLLHRTGR